MVVVATITEHAVPSDRLVGSTAVWRDLPAEQRLADLENTLRLAAWVLADARSQPVTFAFKDLQ
jgi:hypothetical protein